MAATALDALAYARKLETLGFSREQAETQANALREVIEERAVSREYPDYRFRESEARLKKEMKEMEMRLLKWQWGIALPWPPLWPGVLAGWAFEGDAGAPRSRFPFSGNISRRPLKFLCASSPAISIFLAESPLFQSKLMQFDGPARNSSTVIKKCNKVFPENAEIKRRKETGPINFS